MSHKDKIMNKQTLVPTQLFVGPKEKIEELAENFVQSFFCKNNYEFKSEKIQSCFCNQCQKIKHRQHPYFVWISPTKDYILDDIQVIFEKTQFSLDDDQQFFFVLEQSEKLTPATANRLLKVLEEPPTGYNFILLTNNENNILPTIKSRSLVNHFGNIEQTNITQHPILSFFLDSNKLDDPFSFEQELRKQKLTNKQATELINQLLSFISQKIINSHKGQDKVKSTEHLKTIERYLINKLKKPPQTGSANLFFKNIFISFPQ